MCYIYGSVQVATSVCPMCKVFKPSGARYTTPTPPSPFRRSLTLPSGAPTSTMCAIIVPFIPVMMLYICATLKVPPRPRWFTHPFDTFFHVPQFKRLMDVGTARYAFFPSSAFSNTLNEQTPISGRAPIHQPNKLALPILVGLAAVVSRNRVRVA